MDTFTTIHRLATRMFGVPMDPIVRSLPLAEAGIDSLSVTDLVFAIEAHFAVSIAAEELGGVRSLRDVAVVVDRLVTRRTHKHDE